LTVLAFLYKTTNLLQLDAQGRYRVRSVYRSYTRLGFYLDFFIGAYGRVLTVDGRPPAFGVHATALPDGEILARAFAGTANAGGEASALKIVRSLGVRRLLDLGCGPGILLSRLAEEDPSFVGWGIDQSAPMCRSARERLSETGANRRVKVIRGDVRRVSALLTKRQRTQVEAVHAGGLLNSFFKLGADPIVAFIERLVRLFPDRVLLVDDYYSKVRDPAATREDYRLTMLHDITQIFSRQGLPPRCLSEWEQIYRSAGARIIRSFEGNLHGLAWFHHVVQM
jgi:SAM-dependent methyltransferase